MSLSFSTRLRHRRRGRDRLAYRRAVRRQGREATLLAAGPGRSVTEQARRAVTEGCRVAVAAGGDGTVNAVAAAVAGTTTPLGILPTGTLNHFAKDLGLPLELQDAVRVVAEAPCGAWTSVR